MKTIHVPKPSTLGYRMPAEWEGHAATWLAWPHNRRHWFDLLEDIRKMYIEMIRLITPGERVCILVPRNLQADLKQRLRAAGIKLSQVELFDIATQDVWIRDYGPTFLISSNQRAMIQWTFNAWGEKYKDLIKDAGVAHALSAHLSDKVFQASFVMEGGALEVNGCGRCLVTEPSILNPNRAKDRTHASVTQVLADYLGAREVQWLPYGLLGDDTDGHIDDLARFVNSNTLVTCVEHDTHDANFSRLAANLAVLGKWQSVWPELTLVELPMPRAILDGSARTPASYANFYIANHAVLVPQFGDAHDQDALDILKPFFSDRDVMGVRSNALVMGRGGIHCVTQQQPAPRSSNPEP